MSTEETQPISGETNYQQSGESPEQNEPNKSTATAAPAKASDGSSAAVAKQREEEGDEPRPSGEDFGSLLDKFEQEQAGFQEGEVVQGTVVGITERGVVIDFGYKSEGLVNQAEFMEDDQLTVKRGDVVDVLIKHMETSEGFPLLSRADGRSVFDLSALFEFGRPAPHSARRLSGVPGSFVCF